MALKSPLFLAQMELGFQRDLDDDYYLLLANRPTGLVWRADSVRARDRLGRVLPSLFWRDACVGGMRARALLSVLPLSLGTLRYHRSRRRQRWRSAFWLSGETMYTTVENSKIIYILPTVS